MPELAPRLSVVAESNAVTVVGLFNKLNVVSAVSNVVPNGTQTLLVRIVVIPIPLAPNVIFASPPKLIVVAYQMVGLVWHYV
jgi:hypothetical protein